MYELVSLLMKYGMVFGEDRLGTLGYEWTRIKIDPGMLPDSTTKIQQGWLCLQ